MPRREGTVIRVLNNNAVMVELDGTRAILLGRGLGYGRRLGDLVDYADASEVFTPSTPEGFFELSEFVSQIPLEVFRVARRAVNLAAERADVRPSQALLLSIADHLNFAIQRSVEGITIDFPLSWEVRQLYPGEASLGEATVAMARDELGIALDPDEATAFALHFVNAQFASRDLGGTVAMTRLVQGVIQAVKTGLGADAVADPMAMARFVTHLRYLYARAVDENQYRDNGPALISVSYAPEVEATATLVRAVLEQDTGPLTDAELSYLQLHLARLNAGHRGDLGNDRAHR